MSGAGRRDTLTTEASFSRRARRASTAVDATGRVHGWRPSARTSTAKEPSRSSPRGRKSAASQQPSFATPTPAHRSSPCPSSRRCSSPRRTLRRWWPQRGAPLAPRRVLLLCPRRTYTRWRRRGWPPRSERDPPRLPRRRLRPALRRPTSHRPPSLLLLRSALSDSNLGRSTQGARTLRSRAVRFHDAASWTLRRRMST